MQNYMEELGNQLRSFFEFSLNFLFILDLNEIILEINSIALENLEYSREEYINKNFREFLSEDYLETFINYMNKIKQKEKSIEKIIIKLKKKNGDSLYLDFNAVPIQKDDKEYLMLGIGYDITDPKEAERKLIESEEKYRLITENAFDLIAVVNKKYEHIFINEHTYMNILGYSNEDMLGKTRLDLVHPDDLKRGINAYKNGFDTGEGTVELRLKHKQGHYLWFQFKGSAYKDINGNLNGLIIGREITEKKYSEEKLRESEEKFRTITEKSILGIVILQDNVIKYVNETQAKMYGYTVEEVLSWKPGEFIKIYSPEQHEFIIEQGRKKQLGLPDQVQKYQLKAIKKTGEIFWVENYSRTIFYNGKTADLITQVDITEKKRAEEELISLNKLKSELLTRYSHELKTPLMSIRGFIDLLQIELQNTIYNEELSFVEEIKKGCHRLETLVRNILNTAELESGTVVLEPTKNDLCTVVKSCVSELDGFAKSRDCTIKMVLHDKILTNFDSKQINQVLNNILTNAIKFTPPKGTITIQSKINENFVILSFNDTGIGLTEEEKQQLFIQFGKIERFGQGFDVITEGSGLGLYISKKIIELHGGKIWVESEGRNKGSTFYFSLPLI
ncbi:MAG: PAS domain S-box protein [Candidatus Hermodarchaeota archaeon]